MIRKSYDRVYSASPSFAWTNAQLLSGGVQKASWESYNTTTQKYLPFNFTRIVNNGEDDIYFYPNQNSAQAVLIPKGTIISMDRTFIPAISSFSIVHAGTTTITASKIIITCSRDGETTDSVVSRLHARLFGQLKKNSRVI